MTVIAKDFELCVDLFVSASNQTGLDTWSMTQRLLWAVCRNWYYLQRCLYTTYIYFSLLCYVNLSISEKLLTSILRLFVNTIFSLLCLLGLRICWVHPYRRVRHFNECSGYDTKLYLIVWFQFWSFGECEVLLHCHYS